jgi:hypothetical protein
VYQDKNPPFAEERSKYQTKFPFFLSFFLFPLNLQKKKTKQTSTVKSSSLTVEEQLAVQFNAFAGVKKGTQKSKLERECVPEMQRKAEPCSWDCGPIE